MAPFLLNPPLRSSLPWPLSNIQRPWSGSPSWYSGWPTVSISNLWSKMWNNLSIGMEDLKLLLQRLREVSVHWKEKDSQAVLRAVGHPGDHQWGVAPTASVSYLLQWTQPWWRHRESGWLNWPRVCHFKVGDGGSWALLKYVRPSKETCWRNKENQG